jgi:hypothetical protein
MVSFLQWHLKKAGIDGMTLLAIVPYYMSESAYPAASSALLRKLSEFSGLSLPVGDLEQGAAEDFDAFAALVDANPEVQHTVRALEEHYDSFSGDGLGIPLNAVPSAFTVGLGAEKETEITGISDAIEAYLASVTEGATGNTEPSESDEKVIEEKPSVDDLLAEALKRVAERKEGSDSAVGAHVPRHRGSASAAEDSPERAEGPAPESQEGSAE